MLASCLYIRGIEDVAIFYVLCLTQRGSATAKILHMNIAIGPTGGFYPKVCGHTVNNNQC